MNAHTYQKVLVIAGSDSGGGAGIQADIKTISANGGYAETAITALTAQNTLGVVDIFPIPVDFVSLQIQTVLSDIGADAVKIGMLYSAELIETVAAELISFRTPHIVVDPVMVAQSGDSLLQDSAVTALVEKLLPLADIITPNLLEAERLLNISIQGEKEMERAAKMLAQLGSKSVLLKGGHFEKEPTSNDVLYVKEDDTFHWYKAARCHTRNNHGTGCTLSSAIATHLALGKSIPEAVWAAKEYITNAITEGAQYTLGKGSGPVHHFYSFWGKST